MQLGPPAEEAVRAELEQLHSKGVFKPIRNDKREIKTIRSHLFLKVKRDGRVKGRIVADGSKQERSMSTSVSSPTVSSEAVFITAAVEAHEMRHVVTVDIEGAYLHAAMTNDVFMDIEPEIAAILIKMHP
eukprot:scaffold545_cov191-Ochromonas_danica.AAC.1